MHPALIVALGLADVAVVQSHVAPGAAERVVIHIEQHGWSSQKRELVITRGATGYSDGERSIDAALVDALVASATHAPVAALDIASLNVDAARLRAAAESESRGQPPATAARLVERICDPSRLPAIAHMLYSGGWTDDYPSVQVDITLAGGGKVKLATRAQPPLMLPWKVASGSSEHDSWAPAISRAVAALLPAKLVNRERLAGEGLEQKLAEYGSAMVRDSTEREGADEQLGAHIEPLKRRFTIEQSRVASEYSFSVQGDEVFDAWLSSPALGQIRFQLYLTVKDKRAASVEPFLRDADALAARLRALPWLKKYLAQHPRSFARIEYVDDRSVSTAARESVLRGLKLDGAAPVAAEIAPQLDRGVAFYIDDGGNKYAIWVLLPDGRCVLTTGAVPGLPARVGAIL
jgi:hypothetical protein